MPTRFVYRERIKRSRLPVLFKAMSRVMFNTSNVLPDEPLVSLFEKYLMEGDEPADKAARDLFGRESPHAQNFKAMRLALDGDIGALESLPASFVQLINESKEEPPWLDRAQLERGAAVCRRLGLDAMSVLGDLALLGGYANPDISKPLVFTGQLQGENTFDRLGETSQFWYDVTRPGAMEIGSKGFKSAVRVRMMHAIVRQRLLGHPKWESENWGWPINKADSMSTNVAFSMAMIYGVKMLGHNLSKGDMEAVLHLWRYVGFLMGDDADHLPDSMEEGLQWLMLIHFSNRNQPDSGSIALARDYLETFRPDEDVREWDKRLLLQFVYWRHRAYAEYLIPRGLYRKLNVPSSYFTWLLVPLVQAPAIFALDSLRSLIPGGDAWMEAEGSRQQDVIMKVMMGGRQASFVPKGEMAR